MRCHCGKKAVEGYSMCYEHWRDDFHAQIATLRPEDKAAIDAMSREDMARRWRFAPSGDRMMSGVTGEYFAKVFQEKGGMSPEISKSLGWER
jgi:hypothetical protein